MRATSVVGTQGLMAATTCPAGESTDSDEDHPEGRRPAALAVGIASYALADPTEPAGPGAPSPGASVLDAYFPAVHLGDELDGSAWGALLARLTGGGGAAGTALLSGEQVEAASVVLAQVPAAPNGGGTRGLASLSLVESLHVARRFLAARDPGHARGSTLPSSPAVIPRAVVCTLIEDLAAPPLDAYDVYLRLHLLSHRKVLPHGLNLEGMLDRLTTVAWTTLGPFEAATFGPTRAALRARGVEVAVRAVDKVPWMADYVVPAGVRLADAARVRLGAYLAPGTTVMPYGYVNFNAGTLGPAMVEGRISAGTVVGAGSDIGAGASVMGTLSGGGRHVVRVGERCLLGANAGLGISLGDNCAVEAGLYLKADSKVKLLPDGPVVKAETLSGQDDLRFWRNSQTGAIEVARKRMDVPLNPALHKN